MIDRKVEIRPLEEDKWHKQDTSTNYTKPKVLRARVKGRNYDVDFTEEELEELKKRNITVDTSFVDGEPNNIFDGNTGALKLINGSNFLHLEKPEDYIRYKVALNHPFIANSEEELSQWPEAMFIIYDEKAKVEKKAKIVNKKVSAYVKLDSLSDKQLRDVYYIIFKRPTGTNSNDYLKAEISEVIENERKINAFLGIVSLAKEDFTMHAFVSEAIAKNLIKQSQKEGIRFNDDLLGWNINEASEYLKSVKGQELYARIKNSMQAVDKN